MTTRYVIDWCFEENKDAVRRWMAQNAGAMFVIAGFAGLVAAILYGATQVSAGTWDYAVIMLSTGLGVGTGGLMLGAGVARIVAARHAPPDKHVTMIDKAVFTGKQIEGPF